MHTLSTSPEQTETRAASPLDAYFQAGYSIDQIATMLQRALLLVGGTPRLKTLRLHAIDLLTGDNDSFNGFRGMFKLATRIKGSMDDAEMTNEDLTDEEVAPFLLLVGALLHEVKPAFAEDVMTIGEDVQAGVQLVLDPKA